MTAETCPSCLNFTDAHCPNPACDWRVCRRKACGGYGQSTGRWVTNADRTKKGSA